MAPPTELAALTAHLDRFNPELSGKRVAQVDFLAGWRTKHRNGWLAMSIFNFIAAMLNAALLLSPLLTWPWLNWLALGVSTGTMVFCESRARAMTRQLRRPAAEQVARDMLSVKD